MPFPQAAPAAEARKAVTIVFCDLKGSTTLGESLDPEALREVISRYFDEMRAAIDAHGGSIEKFIGDAVMAVFGVPRVREDDALRAVRAAAEMQDRLAVLNGELERRWGVRLENRTGVNSGELVAGKAVAGQRLVIGDAVNVAARLEQAAPPNQVLIGEPTYELVRDVAEVEELEPLALKGKAEPVRAFRLIAVGSGEAVTRHHGRPMVGRERELAALQGALDQAAALGRGRMATVLAQAGMGKSRLSQEFLQRVEDDALVLRGRCLPYGRGITFWPLVEIVRQAAAIEEEDPAELALAKLGALAADGAGPVTQRVAAAVGLGDAQFPMEELFWGVRALFERLAAERPLVVVFDDIHWAERTLLDLIRHVADSAEAPVLTLCLARPELLELQPDWPAGPAAPRFTLAPLSEADMGRIVMNVLGDGSVADEVRARVLAAADGNPLFVEQVVSMLIDDGTLRLHEGRWRPAVPLGEISVPPNIQALLTARVEQLQRDDRAVIDPASVIGLLFPQEALTALVHESVRPAVGERLRSLTSKQLVRPDPSGLATDDAFRFEHLLIRDAVYNRLLKRTRAMLHEGFVEWAERENRAREREIEYEEILGYHLEQAHRYLGELGPLDDRGRALGERAAARLAAAGRRAFARGDMPAAANLLHRATSLMREDDPARLELLPDAAEALVDVGEFAAAQVVISEAVERSRAAGEERLWGRAELVRLLLEAQTGDPAGWADHAVRGAERILPLFKRARDDVGMAAAHRLLAWAHGTACRYGEAAAAARLAEACAARGGDDRQRRRAAVQYAVAAVWGPTPVPEAIASCEQILERASGDRRTEGLVTSLLARLKAMRGEFDAARALSADARAMLEGMGRSVVAASTSLDSCGVDMLAGDPRAAVRALRRDYDALEEMGERYLLSTVAAELARALAECGDDREAERWTRTAEALADDDDVATQALWRWVRARVLARRGETGGALALAREAAGLLESSDSLVARADCLMALGEVLQAGGMAHEARGAIEASQALHERKGDVVSSGRAGSLLLGLAGRAPTA